MPGTWTDNKEPDLTLDAGITQDHQTFWVCVRYQGEKLGKVNLNRAQAEAFCQLVSDEVRLMKEVA